MDISSNKGSGFKVQRFWVKVGFRSQVSGFRKRIVTEEQILKPET
jgi:hypothetical protein